jgi:uncharacterized protein (TIGR03083 family)
VKDVQAATRAERAALAGDLANVTEDAWTRPSLCVLWDVEEVVAHLTAAASLGRLRWMSSVICAGFDFDKHNARRLAEHRGSSPAETLARFQAVIPSTTSTFGPKEAWLGEVVIHGQDIRRAVGVEYSPPIGTLTHLAGFLARTNFTVASKDAVMGVRLQAVDGPFATGAGPLVEGTTLALVMAMAGRITYRADLTGPGVASMGGVSPASTNTGSSGHER